MTPEELENLTRELELQARYQESSSRSIEDYMANLKKLKKLQEVYNRNLRTEQKLQAELTLAQRGTDQRAIDLAQAKLDILQKQNEQIGIQVNAMTDGLSKVNKKSLMGARVLSDSAKMLGKTFMSLPTIVDRVYGKIKGLGLFEIDKSMKQSALSMGVLSKQSAGFRSNIKLASWETNKIGIGIEAVSKLQADYSEELGRSVQLNKDSLIAMSQVGAATSLGIEGAAKMTAELDRQGVSAMATRDFVQQTLNDSHAMGVNASKVMKNASNNIKMLNRYNFRDGIKGLGKMAQTVTKLGVGMEFAASFADKLWDVEGAVDLSAKLQVMGGEFAKMADPFHLMYMARNDIAGLTEELGRAASASAKFNKNGEIEMGAKEMHRLKIIAEQTGVAYDDLITAGKTSFKLKEFGKDVFSGASKEEKEFLAGMAEMKDGKAIIMVKGQPKLLSQMDKATTKSLLMEKESLESRAKNARTFDDALSNTLNGLKLGLLPIIEVINSKLLPKIDGFVSRFEKENWGQKIEVFASTVGNLISTLGGFIIDNPLTSALVYLSTKAMPLISSITGYFWDKAKWFTNGVELGMGFNTVAGSTNPGTVTNSFMDRLGKTLFKNTAGASARTMSGFGKNVASGLGSAGAIGGGLLSGGISAYSEWDENSKAGMDSEQNAKRTSMRGLSSLGGALGGAALGAAIGSAVPVLGTVIGGLIGGAIGGLGGDKLGDWGGDAVFGSSQTNIYNSPINDGIIGGSKNNKSPNLGPNFTKNRGIIESGKITPIDNKDDLVALKPGGVIDQSTKTKQVTTIKHVFEDMNINGEIKISLPGNPGYTIDLAKDPQFIRDLTKTIQSQIEKNINGGKNRG